MIILGISAYYHDSAACILCDGKIIAAAQEERFTRKKHDENFPKNAIKYCINEAKIIPSEIDHVVFYEKPFLKFERLLETYFAFAPKGLKSFSMFLPIWVKDKLFQKHNLIKELEANIDKKDTWEKKILFSEHHLSHAASAYFPSPFNQAAILTLDGVGEWATTSISIGKNNNLEFLREINFPHSLGFLYSAFTYYAGFKVNSGEYKLMGLAPYGIPKYTKIIKDNLIKIMDDGSFQLNMDYFDFCTGLKMTNNKFHKLFGGLPRKQESKISQKEMDLAASVQKVTEEIIIKIAKHVKKITGENNLCLAGGVALNCVANGILQKKKIFDNIWIQPAAGDAGGALGAALAVWHLHYKKEKNKEVNIDLMNGSFLGPSFDNNQIEKVLKSKNATYEYMEENKLLDLVAKMLTKGKAIGWMQGRMEFGPRALGARSIIADPRNPTMQKQLNLKIKFRESFRPFAPSIIEEHLSEWFDQNFVSPYMLFVSQIKKNKRLNIEKDENKLFGIDKLNISRSIVPAITHVDFSSRIQTVNKKTNIKYYNLIKKFNEFSGCPIIVNTSFNIRGEPIVCSPEDAYNCFMGTNLDILVIENFILFKENQLDKKIVNYSNKYELD